MSAPTVYFGALPKAGQSVSDDVRRLGIELLRLSPCDISFHCFIEAVQPGHALYRSYLPHFLDCAINNIVLDTTALNFRGIDWTGLLPTYRDPTVVWSYNTPLSEEYRHALLGNGAIDTVARGKPAMMARLNLVSLAKLNDVGPSPIVTTATAEGQMNIFAFKMYILINRIADAYLRLNQYPAFRTEDGQDTPEFGKTYECGPGGLIKTPATSDTPETTQQYIGRRGKIHANLVSAFDKTQVYVSSPNDFLADSEGIIFPYVPALARHDTRTVVHVISRFFSGCLGYDLENATQMMTRLQSAMGNIAYTSEGDELAHLFKGIELSLDTQTMLRIIMPTPGAYGGFILFGSRYQISHGERSWTPVSSVDLAKAFITASPHARALERIKVMIKFDDDPMRNNWALGVRSLRAVREAYLRYGISPAQHDDFLREASFLTFPAVDYLSPNSSNISRLLRTIRSGEEPAEVPIHPSMLLENNRTKRLWSAFGSYAPSFLVPGGKKMALGSTFEVSIKLGAARGSRSVRKIAAIIIPLRQAAEDIITVLETKDILNPFGTSVGGRISMQSTIKTYEGDHAEDVLGALRLAAGVNITAASGAGKGKRKDTEGDEGNVAKRSRGMADLF